MDVNDKIGMLAEPDWRLAFQPHAMSVLHSAGSSDFRLLNLCDADALEMLVKVVRLRGNPAVRIYERSVVQLKRMRIAELAPTSLYVLSGQIRQHTELFWRLMNDHHQNLFDLTGILDYEQNGKMYRMVPPLIETYYEPALGRTVSAIIDGLHRLATARNLGIREAWVIEVNNIPAALPAIALPVGWDDVRTYDAMPPAHAKRRYRYDSAEAMRAATAQDVTPENYQYYLYRDLSLLGSAGIRPPGSNG